MELYQLRGFVAIAAAGTLTRAARHVHVTQPALTAQLKALEDELGLALFDRTPGGMKPTAAGRRLLRHAERVLAAAQSLKDEARALKGEASGRLSIGTISDPEFIRLGALMAEVVARHPRVELQLHLKITGEALQQVVRGQLDASFYYGDIADPQVAHIALRDMVYRVVSPAAWRERLAGADWPAMAREPWIIPPPISTHHMLAHRLLDRHGVVPERIVEADNEGVVSSLVASGVGVALMREDTALQWQQDGRVALWGNARTITTLWFIHRAERARDPVIDAVREALLAVWPDAKRAGGRR